MAVQANELLAGRYRVLRRLGAGGAASVFLCEDERLGRKVAVKRMHAHSPDDVTRRLRREARLGASLSHPNLVAVFDTGTYDEGVLIVMEYVEGETLADALRRGTLPVPRALEVLRGVASALDCVHSQGIVHRDVKPANVLLGSAGTVKLADLGVGIARDHTRITQIGQVLGTPAYMSPEQVDGAEPTPAVDVYALGALAYEMLTGEKAIKGSTPLEIARRVTMDPPPDLRRAWPDAPAAAAEAISRAMARDPASRPAGAGELVDELQRAFEEPATRPLERTVASTPAPGAPPARRAPGWLTLVALLAVAGAVVLVIALAGGGSAGKPKTATRHHARQHRAATTRPATHAAPPVTGTAPAATSAPSASALNDQGKVLIDAGRPADAIPVLQRALAAFPAAERSSIVYGWTLYNLGDAYLRAGQPQQAIPLLRARLAYPGQTGLVRAELQRAEEEATGAAPAPAPPGHGPGKGKSLKKGHGEGH